MAYSERELLARIIQCEAGGEGDNGMRAVASVVMNRVNVANRRISESIKWRKYKKYYISSSVNLIVQQITYMEHIIHKTYTI